METEFNNSTNVEDSTSARLTQNPCYVQPFSEVFNEDCIQVMKRYPDKFFDLAVVDPPYGIKADENAFKNGVNCKANGFKEHKNTNWDNSIPPKEYFKELFRISKNQIIWGGNYFIEYLYNTRGIICWDKKQMMETLSRWEFGWTSFDKVAKTYEVRSQELNRFHPTQKPISLYKFCLDNYAKQGDKILDTHLGSGSIAIACHDYGFELTACELDKEYYDKAIQRIKNHISQIKMEF